MKILVTGAAGFIGAFLCKRLLETTNDEIIGLDNLNDYYVSIGGDYGIASFASGQRLYLFAIMPLTSIGSAVAAVSGSAYGAKNGDYLSRTHLYGAKFGIAFGTAVTIILVAFAPQLSTIFAYTPETAPLVPEITRFLRIAVRWSEARPIFLLGIVLLLRIEISLLDL